MSIQELGTIMEQQAPVKVILLNNNYLGNVRQWQDMFFNKRKSFTRMLNPDYRTFGGMDGRLDDAAALLVPVRTETVNPFTMSGAEVRVASSEGDVRT